VNGEDGTGDRVGSLLVHPHERSKRLGFSRAGSLYQLPLFICITRGNGQALSPLRLKPIGLR
jgi:hypothetical protein